MASIKTMLAEWLQKHRAGLLISGLFFAAYFFTALQLNFADNDTVDNFLDADNYAWVRRIADPGGHVLEMRGPHPFAYLILRPPGLALNLFFNDPTRSAVILNTLAGALCVLLVWIFTLQASSNKIYAGLIAVLYGLSASQFFFASVVESYIFSAAALIAFYTALALKKERESLWLAVVTFGITLTNFAQVFIGYLIARPRIKEIAKFTGIVLGAGVVLSLLHAAMYPSARLFFIPAGAKAEDEFFVNILKEPSWRALGRVQYLARTMFLYTVAAPEPFVFTTEVGGTFPRFNFFRISPETYSLSSYHGAGKILILLWVGLLLASGVLYLYDLYRTRKADLRTAFLLCLLFNFALHLIYGYELFLYSADWAYALILFAGLSLARFANHRAFQAGFALFLALLAFNQIQFFQFILTTISPFINQ